MKNCSECTRAEEQPAGEGTNINRASAMMRP